ncbi:MAG: prepilin-type N-terminal cleavage/methylation domain-containing protein [Deltaproteobacteria bacterium]
MKKGKGASGFTLLELIVTFTILSLVVVMILGALRLGSASWERGEERVEKVQKKRIVFELLSQQMKSSFPYRIKSQKAEADFLAFLGERTSLRFVSAFSIRARKQEGLVFVIYKVEEEGASGKTLKVYEKRVLNKNFLEETPDEEQFLTLTDGLSDLSFEYFDEGPAEGRGKHASGEWVESWDTKEKKALPSQVKIIVTWKEKKAESEIALPAVVSLPARVYDDRGRPLSPPLTRPTPR